MANPSVLNADTVLYSAAEPNGRLFPAGESWPGDAWSTNPGGDPLGEGLADGARKDVAKAQSRIDALTATVESNANDLAVSASERDAANGKVADLEQRALAAEQGQEAADGRAHDYMAERDQARSDFQRVSDQVTAANARNAELEADAAKVADLTAQLETANQTIADLNGKVAELEKATAKPAKGAKPAADAPDAPDAT